MHKNWIFITLPATVETNKTTCAVHYASYSTYICYNHHAFQVENKKKKMQLLLFICLFAYLQREREREWYIVLMINFGVNLLNLLTNTTEIHFTLFCFPSWLKYDWCGIHNIFNLSWNFIFIRCTSYPTKIIMTMRRRRMRKKRNEISKFQTTPGPLTSGTYLFVSIVFTLLFLSFYWNAF